MTCFPGGTRSLHVEVGIAPGATTAADTTGGVRSIAPLSNGVEKLRQVSGLQAFRKSACAMGIALGGSTKKHMSGCNPDGTHVELKQYGWLPNDAQSSSVLHGKPLWFSADLHVIPDSAAAASSSVPFAPPSRFIGILSYGQPQNIAQRAPCRRSRGMYLTRDHARKSDSRCGWL